MNRVVVELSILRALRGSSHSVLAARGRWGLGVQKAWRDLVRDGIDAVMNVEEAWPRLAPSVAGVSVRSSTPGGFR